MKIDSFIQFESKSHGVDISKELIVDIFQDLMDSFDCKFEVDYKIFSEKIVGVCMYNSELENGFKTHARYEGEFDSIGDKFSEIFSECKKSDGWVTSRGLVSRMFLNNDRDKIILECSDRMNNHLEFRKPIIESGIYCDWNYETGYSYENDGLVGYLFIYTNEDKK
jgi:hypothetical protein